MFVSDEKRYAVPFQTVVLPCHYTTVSTQTVVVQWVYKSYCRDRTRDSFGLSDGLGGGQGGGALQGNVAKGGVHRTGLMSSYLDCSDSSRTVRTVASVSGSSLTLSEFYKSRDISIINGKTCGVPPVLGSWFCRPTCPQTNRCVVKPVHSGSDGLIQRDWPTSLGCSHVTRMTLRFRK